MVRGSVLRSVHLERMEQILDIDKHYHVSNIFNIDESGLSYPMSLHRTYLSGSDQRDTVHGTEFGKHKERVTIFLTCNVDGSHVLPEPTPIQPIILAISEMAAFITKKIVIGPKRMVGWISKDSIIVSSGGIMMCNLVPTFHGYL